MNWRRSGWYINHWVCLNKGLIMALYISWGGGGGRFGGGTLDLHELYDLFFGCYICSYIVIPWLIWLELYISCYFFVSLILFGESIALCSSEKIYFCQFCGFKHINPPMKRLEVTLVFSYPGRRKHQQSFCQHILTSPREKWEELYGCG